MATTARRPRTELERAGSQKASPPRRGEQDGALLAVKQRIIDQEVRIRQVFLHRRLSILSIPGGTAFLVSLVVIGNLFIDFSTHGAGRYWLNIVGGLLVIALVCLASYNIWQYHNELQGMRGYLAKLTEEKRLLSSMNAIGAVAGQRRYKEEIHGFIEEYRQEAKHNRRIHNSFQSIIIIGSIATTSVTSAIGQQPAFKMACRDNQPNCRHRGRVHWILQVS